jgi:hypothetical protein
MSFKEKVRKQRRSRGCVAHNNSFAGIDTLTAAVGRNAPHHGSGCEAAVPPDRKRLGPKRLEDAARQQVALDIEGVLDSGMNREEALG